MSEDYERSRGLTQISVHEPVDWLCKVFEVTRSCYCAQRLRRRTPDVEPLGLRSRVNELFTQSGSAAGWCSHFEGSRWETCVFRACSGRSYVT